MSGANARRTRRPARASGGVPQRPYGRVTRPYAPISVLSDDHVEMLHRSALRVLSDIGMRVLDTRAREFLKKAGATIKGEMVHFDPGMIAERLATVPKEFSLLTRNPKRNLHFGGNDCVFASVGGPAYVMDNDGGRRDGTYAEMCDFLRLVQSLNILHQEGGCPFEPMDLPANTRHLDIYRAQITLLD